MVCSPLVALKGVKASRSTAGSRGETGNLKAEKPLGCSKNGKHRHEGEARASLREGGGCASLNYLIKARVCGWWLGCCGARHTRGTRREEFHRLKDGPVSMGKHRPFFRGDTGDG